MTAKEFKNELHSLRVEFEDTLIQNTKNILMTESENKFDTQADGNSKLIANTKEVLARLDNERLEDKTINGLLGLLNVEAGKATDYMAKIQKATIDSKDGLTNAYSILFDALQSYNSAIIELSNYIYNNAEF